MQCDIYDMIQVLVSLGRSETLKFVTGTLKIVIRCELGVGMMPSHLDAQIGQDLAISGNRNRIFNVEVTQHHANH